MQLAITHLRFLRYFFFLPPVARRLCSESREIPVGFVGLQATVSQRLLAEQMLLRAAVVQCVCTPNRRMMAYDGRK